MKHCLLSVLIIIGCAAYPFWSAGASADGAAKQSERLRWWSEARFGMFIHWGLYAVPAGSYDGKPIKGIGEWIMKRAPIPHAEYAKFAPRFNPTKFDAERWVTIAKDAGMKYIVITSKHHDGFCLFDADNTEWDIVDATPFDRDIIKELAAACRKHDMPFGLYYSTMDWHHPAAQALGFPDYGKVANPKFESEYVPYMKQHLKQLLSGEYGKIDILWFDGEWIREWDEDLGRDLEEYVRSLQPDILINNRAGKHRKSTFGDFGTPEQKIPDKRPDFAWETCMTINDTWGFKADDHNWKSPRVLVENLIDIVSKDGNYLLNVGPTAQGVIPDPSVERLAAIGDWMDRNGASIYGCGASEIAKPGWGRITESNDGRTIYLHIFERPADGGVSIPMPKAGVKQVQFLPTGKALAATTDDRSQRLRIDLPALSKDALVPVIAVYVAE